jgi:TPR repeat protein
MLEKNPLVLRLLTALTCLALVSVARAQDAASDQTVLISILRDEALAYEHGDGVERDGMRAAALYCQAARLGDAESQFNLGWLYTNGRGVERSESTAAFFFNAAAEQGFEQARRMLGTVGGPTADVPGCMRAPARPASLQVRVAAAPVQRAAEEKPFSPKVEVISRAPKPLIDLVKQMAPEYRLEPQLVLSIIETESNFDTVALSPKNAKGLMQLIPETAARFGVRNAYDPAQNIRGGMAYLRWLLAYFEGDVSLVAAAYNAGETAVERYRGVPPYLETLTYVRKVLTGARMVEHGFDASVTQPSPQLRFIRDPLRSR